MNLACVLMHMTMEESLVAATLNAAYSLRLSEIVGSIEIGKQADLIILNSQKLDMLRLLPLFLFRCKIIGMFFLRVKYYSSFNNECTFIKYLSLHTL